MRIVRSAVAAVLVTLVCTSAQKVQLEFYGESLCPYCAGFATTALANVFKEGIADLAAFRYIGWGNVQKLGEGHYACQHGPLECKMNTVLNCGQDLSTNQDQFFDFLYCIESQAGPSVDTQIPGCAKTANLELSKLEKCYKGSKGKQLDDEARRDTDSLQPAHTYVPWVTVNGVPLFDKVDDIASYICVAYNGTRPAACYTEERRSIKQSPHHLFGETK